MKKKWTLRRILRAIWIAGGLGFMSWLLYSYQSRGVNAHWLEDSTTVSVQRTGDFFSFSPTGYYDRVMLFYPGAMVDPRAYVPLCRQIADRGVKVYLIRMPWRMAMYGYNKPIELNLLADTTKTYIPAGHSQGAKMAARFVYEHPGLIDKLVLIGTTHPRDISLSDRTLPVLKIYGSKDGVAEEADILANRGNLPATAEVARIEGANHAQFGYYGFQFGDSHATISRAEQQAKTLQHILGFIN
ncbi:alpha/beta hydrolase [Parapedobacter sp. GCM10030251]|uniref:alpha/beta hydrolase n=1 Tax=Parapedobacter sp. GCM10030251 TaxID=3273419 RepID=UPI0036172125